MAWQMTDLRVPAMLGFDNPEKRFTRVVSRLNLTMREKDRPSKSSAEIGERRRIRDYIPCDQHDSSKP
jgi:hypothetical protein